MLCSIRNAKKKVSFFQILRPIKYILKGVTVQCGIVLVLVLNCNPRLICIHHKIHANDCKFTGKTVVLHIYNFYSKFVGDLLVMVCSCKKDKYAIQ